jgi:hypothetical protein
MVLVQMTMAHIFKESTTLNVNATLQKLFINIP